MSKEKFSGTRNSKIPATIMLTYKNKNIPDGIIEKWRILNPNYTVIFFTDDDVKKFLKDYYGAEYVDFFTKIPVGCFKADFFRLCYLYIQKSYKIYIIKIQ